MLKTITIATITLIIGLLLAQPTPKDRLYAAIGKLESDSGICLTDDEIRLIHNSGLVDTYQNYLFEIDYRMNSAGQCGDQKAINSIIIK